MYRGALQKVTLHSVLLLRDPVRWNGRMDKKTKKHLPMAKQQCDGNRPRRGGVRFFAVSLVPFGALSLLPVIVFDVLQLPSSHGERGRFSTTGSPMKEDRPDRSVCLLPRVVVPQLPIRVRSL